MRPRSGARYEPRRGLSFGQSMILRDAYVSLVMAARIARRDCPPLARLYAGSARSLIAEFGERVPRPLPATGEATRETVGEPTGETVGETVGATAAHRDMVEV